MAAKLFACYGRPVEPAAFDRHYSERHVPLAKTVPGIRSDEVTRGPVAGLDGDAQWHRVAVPAFDSMQALQSALASREGQATAADLAAFATGGVQIFFAETESV